MIQRLGAWLVFWGALALGLLSAVARAEAGVVAFALGQSSVERGQSVYVGDVIRTGSDGHVHLRFVDGALLSLRPNSELSIDEYTYVPDQPDQNRVRFTLRAGTVRSVSGEAGRLNKEGYRMNTPISAIGIRGTDYTVIADDQSTQVRVIRGGIAIAPLDGQCRPDQVGSCEGDSTVEVGAGEFYRMSIDQLSQQGFQRSNWGQGDLQLSGEVLAIDSFVDTDADVLAQRTQDSDVAWAHWVNFEGVLGSRFKSTQPLIREGWQVSGANGLFGLFARDAAPAGWRDGTIEFELQRYEAYSLSNQTLRPAEMSAGTLTINFDSRQFQVHMDVSSPDITTQIHQSGQLSSQGYLTSRWEQGRLSGVLVDQGRGAGLLFEQRVDGGQVMGASDWHAQ